MDVPLAAIKLDGRFVMHPHIFLTSKPIVLLIRLLTHLVHECAEVGRVLFMQLAIYFI